MLPLSCTVVSLFRQKLSKVINLFMISVNDWVVEGAGILRNWAEMLSIPVPLKEIMI